MKHMGKLIVLMLGVLLMAPVLTATAQELPSSWWVGTIEVTDDGIFFHGEECTQEEEGAEPVCEPLEVGLDMSLAPAGAFNPSAVDPEEEVYIFGTQLNETTIQAWQVGDPEDLEEFFGDGDLDNDGVADDVDQCADTAEGAAVDDFGCAEGQSSDTDGDGVMNNADECADTPAGETVNEAGCPDTDGDGVFDNEDQCADTPEGEVADESGCSESQQEEEEEEEGEAVRNPHFCGDDAEGLQHPAGAKIAAEFDVEYEEVAGYFCEEGRGWGEVKQAYRLGEKLAEKCEEAGIPEEECMSAADLLEMRDGGDSWGKIKKAAKEELNNLSDEDVMEAFSEDTVGHGPWSEDWEPGAKGKANRDEKRKGPKEGKGKPEDKGGGKPEDKGNQGGGKGKGKNN